MYDTYNSYNIITTSHNNSHNISHNISHNNDNCNNITTATKHNSEWSLRGGLEPRLSTNKTTIAPKIAYKRQETEKRKHKITKRNKQL